MAMPNGREMSRAERFEDEKRRIIDSCFSKTDDDGSSMAAPLSLPTFLPRSLLPSPIASTAFAPTATRQDA